MNFNSGAYIYVLFLKKKIKLLSIAHCEYFVDVTEFYPSVTANITDANHG
jgi:hypothetical protein